MDTSSLPAPIGPVIPSTIIREIAKDEGAEPNRENLQKIGKRYRKKEGKGFLGRKAVEMIEKSKDERIAINGIRNPEEVEVLRENLGRSFKLILVQAENQIRFERLSNRKRTGDPERIEEFKKQDRDEKEKFNMEKTFSMSNKRLDNNGSFEELHKNIDKILKDLTNE